MAKVKFIKAAGKDYPKFGIKKGESHYVWAMKAQVGGVVRRSKTLPRESQKTLSSYKSSAHSLNEVIEDLKTSSVEDLESAVEYIVSSAEELRDEVQGSLDNMPEGLQKGSTGELLQARIEALDSFIDELQSIDFEEFDHDEEHENYSDDLPVNGEGNSEQEHIDQLLAEIQNINLDVE